MNNEPTFVIIKPDGLRKSLTGNILTRLSETKLKIIGAKVIKVDKKLAEMHYQHLKDKPFFSELIKYITGEIHGENRVMAMIYWGEDGEVCVKGIQRNTKERQTATALVGLTRLPV